MVHLRNIATAARFYAEHNGGHFPKRIDQTWRYVRNARCYVCPASAATPSQGKSTDEIVSDLNNPAHCSYVYVGAGLTLDGRKNPMIAYEPSGNHPTPGIHVAYADGTVASLDADEGARVIAHVNAGRNPPPPEGN